MNRNLKRLIAVLGMLSLYASAPAARENAGCPAFDKHLPEKSTICKGNAIWVCEDGQWRRQDGTRCTPPRS